ncbi:dTDP-glucose 4,6-dehydratase [Bacillaceae bacterium CLA-AA-H227]|uniref:dTDP-glucose 4,6-dehydratase n=1 Tax=Robertmurraya yapensis (ex Hitch et al 2024) TaxID=3133160 RepID=A0ACC6SC91_9BACI
MNLLITGGAGFIASNFLPYILDKYEDIQIVNLDKLTYAGSMDNLKEIKDNPRHLFIQGDICDRQLVEKIFREYNIDGVIHFAAESHVDNSIKNPGAFIETNVMGTFTLLEVARNYWMSGPKKYKPEFQDARFHHISTDEVFGALGNEGYFTEETPYAPNSPYSASKASSDQIVRSYFHTYGMNVVTTNCSNNFGPKQHEEKLIPTIIRKALSVEPIPIYGTGKNIRDWLYVLDHCKAIGKVFFEGRAGETYLIGGHSEKTNLDMALSICEILDEEKSQLLIQNGLKSFKDLITFVNDRPGHDFRYAVNDSKLREEFNIPIDSGFRDNLKQTIRYYCELFDRSAK